MEVNIFHLIFSQPSKSFSCFNPALVSKKKIQLGKQGTYYYPILQSKKLRFKIYITTKGERVESSRTWTQTLLPSLKSF